MLQPTSQHFGPSSELHLQGVVYPGRNVNPRVKHLPACHDFGTRDVVISGGRNRPAGVSDGILQCVSFHPQCAAYSGETFVTGSYCAKGASASGGDFDKVFPPEQQPPKRGGIPQSGTLCRISSFGSRPAGLFKRKRRIVFNEQQASDLTKDSGQRMNSSRDRF